VDKFGLDGCPGIEVGDAGTAAPDLFVLAYLGERARNAGPMQVCQCRSQPVGIKRGAHRFSFEGQVGVVIRDRCAARA
jgi:hypothetical protein